MTFQQVGSIIAGPLPASARRHRPWWANDATGPAHASAWLGAGYRTEHVDTDGEHFVFVKIYQDVAGGGNGRGQGGLPTAGRSRPAPHDRRAERPSVDRPRPGPHQASARS